MKILPVFGLNKFRRKKNIDGKYGEKSCILGQ